MIGRVINVKFSKLYEQCVQFQLSHCSSPLKVSCTHNAYIGNFIIVKDDVEMYGW